MRAVISALAIAAASSTASAAVISYSATIPIGQTNWSMNPSLPQWDPALFPGQTLVGVKLTVNASVLGDARAESLDASPSVITYGVSATVTATGPGGLVVNVLPLAGGNFNASAFDGSNDFGGTSGFSLLNITNSASNSNSFTNPPDNLAAYIGAATFLVPTTAVGTSSASGPGNLVSSFRTLSGADVIIEYTYIPAPGAIGVLGFGALVATRRRRN